MKENIDITDKTNITNCNAVSYNLTKGGSTRLRDSNLELFRIIAMMLIVAHHYVVNSGLTSPGGPVLSNYLSFKSLFFLLFGAWGKIGINCFVLITGYFMCKSQITLRKFLKLLLEIEFYKIVFYLIFLLTGYQPFSVRTFITGVFPITNVSTGFVSCYLLFFLFIPFLNILIQNMNEKQHLLLVALCSFVYIILGTLPFPVRMNYVSWFIVLYFIASYIRLYPKKISTNTKFWMWMTLCSFLICLFSVIVCTWLGAKLNLRLHYYFVADSNKVPAVVMGICAFMFFKNIKLKYSKFINTIAASTFGVLLIHANSDAMRQWLWKDTLDNVGMFYSQYCYIHAIGSVLCIFAICAFIDYLRIRFLEVPFFKYWDAHSSKVLKY